MNDGDVSARECYVSNKHNSPGAVSPLDSVEVNHREVEIDAE